MAAACEIDDTNKETTYIFRFGTTKRVIHLTEEQLSDIPYLSLLVTHNNDFSSVQNENGEYVLDSRIRYSWFMPIFQSITTRHPSALFTELPQEAHVWSMLQLYDYLCINPISVPLLKDQHLVRTTSDNIDERKFRVEYSRANNRLEVRDIAAQFIIALTKNEYNFEDYDTLQSIFSLIMVVLSNSNIFGVRLCHHMMTVTKKLCFSLFSSTQQRELQGAEKSIRNIKAHCLIYLCDGHQTLPKHCQNVFAWKGVYVPIKEKDNTDEQLICSQKTMNSESPFEYNLWDHTDLFAVNLNFHSYFASIELNDTWLSTSQIYTPSSLFDTPSFGYINDFPWNLQVPGFIENPLGQYRNSYEIEQERKKMEAKSARSGYFNTLPKRPKVDKFKHRCGPKAQKHR